MTGGKPFCYGLMLGTTFWNYGGERKILERQSVIFFGQEGGGFDV